MDTKTHIKQVIEREHQLQLEYDNIFEVLTSDSKTANTLKDRSNEYIKLREAGQAIAKQASYTSSIHTPDDYASALELLELLSEDYESNVLLIDALTASILGLSKRYAYDGKW